MHERNIVYAGIKLPDAQKALIMLHGRGAHADDILSIMPYLHVQDFAVLAPQASGNSWYPYTFLMPPHMNEPWLSSALGVIQQLENEITDGGIPKERIYFAGFSQGACLALEYLARNASRYGGLAAFSGGLIGDRIYEENYSGDFGQTPVFLGSSDPDPHIPVERVTDSADIYQKMNARVIFKIYPNMGHTINQEEIDTVNREVFG